jgi:hypothetical protein
MGYDSDRSAASGLYDAYGVAFIPRDGLGTDQG